MNDTLKMYGSIGSEITNKYFVVAICFKHQPRWRRLQTINTVRYIFLFLDALQALEPLLLQCGSHVSGISHSLEKIYSTVCKKYVKIIFFYT